MWKSLGFLESPYDTRPLRPSEEDARLLIGREDESFQLFTILDSAKEGVFILSGTPGVGKTSFLNVQQYLLANGHAPFGPKILPAYQLCPIQPGDTPRDIAVRVLNSLINSIETHCTLLKTDLPKQTKEIARWSKISGSGGFEVGIQILGFGANVGRSTTLPKLSDASFESIRDAITCVAGEICQAFDIKSILIALDNIENLSDEQLQSTLITFRDTLFMVPSVWWAIIGQRGLGSLIQTLDPRISDRINGTILELEPLTFEQLQSAIEKRVHKFNKTKGATSPLADTIHQQLYKASNGEIRFIFKYSSAICQGFMNEVRRSAAKDDPRIDMSERITLAVTKIIVDSQIPTKFAEQILTQIIKQDMEGLNLSPKKRAILIKIFEKGETRPSDFEEFGLRSTQDFYTNYLGDFFQQNLLFRRQEGKAVYYKLRGVISLAAEKHLL